MAASVAGARRQELTSKGRIWWESAVNTQTHGNKQLTSCFLLGFPAQVAGANRPRWQGQTGKSGAYSPPHCIRSSFRAGRTFPSLEPGPLEAQLRWALKWHKGWRIKVLQPPWLPCSATLIPQEVLHPTAWGTLLAHLALRAALRGGHPYFHMRELSKTAMSTGSKA